jgi:hypothetical protein
VISHELTTYLLSNLAAQSSLLKLPQGKTMIAMHQLALAPLKPSALLNPPEHGGSVPAYFLVAQCFSQSWRMIA